MTGSPMNWLLAPTARWPKMSSRHFSPPYLPMTYLRTASTVRVHPKKIASQQALAMKAMWRRFHWVRFLVRLQSRFSV